MLQRIVVSSITIALLTFAITFSYHPYLSWLVPLLCIICFGAALKEYYDLTKAKHFQALEWIGQGLSALYILGIFFNVSNILGILVLSLFLIFAALFYKGKKPLDNSAVTLFGLFYLTIPLGCVLQILYLPEGRLWVFFLLAVTYVGNTMALFSGKALGKHKLAPFISPKKTWEGALGGFIAALITSLGFYIFSGLNFSLGAALLLGSILGIAAHFGDLAESLLKRDAGVKDSGFIPGLGGMLDMVDSLVFTAPLLYLYLTIFS